jgi:hypothetical protein
VPSDPPFLIVPLIVPLIVCRVRWVVRQLPSAGLDRGDEAQQLDGLASALRNS